MMLNSNILWMFIFAWWIHSGNSLQKASMCPFECKLGSCLELHQVCNKVIDCPDGWDESDVICQCGKAYDTINNQPGVHLTTTANYPWHVAIYRFDSLEETQFICSGSIITENLVISAAHCFFDRNYKYEFTSLRVVAGQQYFDYSDRGSSAQVNTVESMILAENYSGDNDYYSRNIIILKLTNEFTFREGIVGPICLPRSNMRGFDPKKLVRIPGWGFTTGPVSNELQEFLAPSLTAIQCKRNNQSKLISFEKFCIVLNDHEKIQEIDSGSGAVVLRNDHRFYLYGVVSLNKVEMNRYGLITNVSKHLPWLEAKLNELSSGGSECPKDNFFCGHGVCISNDLLCDGVENCDNGADERKTACNPGAADVSCKMPKNPPGGQYKLESCGVGGRGICSAKAGEDVPLSAILRLVCYKGYSLAVDGRSANLAVCNVGNTWFPSLPTCLKLCKFPRTETLNLVCKKGNVVVNCDRDHRPGTTITFECKQNHDIKDRLSFVTQISCQPNGKWTKTPTECNPQCGIANPATLVTLQISIGKDTHILKHPWHVGIYLSRTNEQICGGNILTKNVVITAAHCLFPSTSQLNENELKIAAGKYYRDWNHHESAAQFLELKKIYKHELYHGSKTSFDNDIALLVTKERFHFNNFVLPVCLDPSRSPAPPPGTKGTVVGWGLTEHHKSSDMLLEAEMRYLDLNTCRQRYAHANFAKFITIDKICVLFENGSGTQKGDSGGGYTFKFGNQYFLFGLVSLKPTGINEYAGFTNVTYHMKWIKDHLERIKEERF